MQIEELSFTYAGKDRPALAGINLSIKEGEFLLITGPTGCGKSTLLKTLNGLIPAEVTGNLEGKVQIRGVPVTDLNHHDRCSTIGLIFQNPDDQLFTTKVEEEVGFGLENLNLSQTEMERRITAALCQVGLEDFRHGSTFNLSGGEKQRLAIASVLAMQPAVLALDEPLAQLDLIGVKQVLEVLLSLKKRGVTVILVEHRLPWVVPYATHVVVMNQGKVLFNGSPQALSPDLLQELGLKPKAPPRFSDLETLKMSLTPVRSFSRQDWILKAEGLSYLSLLKDISFCLFPGEIVAIVGPNGAGKSTLLHLLAGLLSPTQGRILSDKSAGLVLQNPDLMLFSKTVWEEVAFGLKSRKIPPGQIAQRVEAILRVLNLMVLKDDAPQALSRGQRLRVAVASVLALNPDILLLDEPTSGQDAGEIERLMHYLKTLTLQGRTVAFVTHDLDVAFKWADRIFFMEQGQIVFCGEKGGTH
ncbi:MAG: energy-coupling factor transporter ATPase [Candidatus Desulfofervidaceae bacterium]|nr:energy-coupling factor transporter ATPase [Candidatus Desulfofervidaceae bacterium]